MGLLKLGSIYKKKNKKSNTIETASPPPLPTKLEPISLDLNLNLNEFSSSSIDANIRKTDIVQEKVEKNNAAPAGSGSLFEDIFAELGTTKSTSNKQEQSSSLFDNDFSLALALSQQLEIQENGTHGMTGTTKSGSNMSNSSNLNRNNNNNATTDTTATTTATKSTLFGGDSIYSNYLKGLSALDNNESTTSSSLSTSMFDSILNKNTTNTNQSRSTTVIDTLHPPPPPVTQVVLDSDISDSDEDSKNSEDSDDEYDVLNINGKTQRRTKGVKPIMERRAQDNRLLVQRKIDNWSNKVDPEANRAELNESMIARMKDRHRNQVKLAALRNQQQIQEDSYNMMGYPQQQSQHMVPQPYGAPTMMPPMNGAVLPHPGMLMDPVQMYYPNTSLQQQQQQQQINDYSDLPQHSTSSPPPPAPIPAAFLPNPTHVSLSIPHPPKEEEQKQEQPHEEHQQQHHNLMPPQHHYNHNSSHHNVSLLPQTNKTNSVMMLQSNNNSRTTNNSTTNIRNARPSSSTPPSSVSSTTSAKTPSSSTVTIEKIDDVEQEIDRNNESSPVLETVTVLEQQEVEMAAEEADCEISGDEEINHVCRTVASPKRKKSMKKLRSSKNDVSPIDGASGAFDSGYTQPPQVVRSSRSTPNLKKNKKKSGSSRNSSRRNSQDFATSPISDMVATPPPLPNNSPYINYNNNSDENLFYDHTPPLPRSSSQHQLHQQHFQVQQQRHSLRHMKSEPDLPRRMNNNNLTNNNAASSIAYQQQKLFQQQQQLNLEWERMQNYQREQLLKHQVNQPSPPVPFMPMYTNMYYPSPTTTPPSMMGPSSSYQQQPYQQQPYQQQPYQQQNPATYSSAPYQSYHQQQNNKYKAPYHHPTTRP